MNRDTCIAFGHLFHNRAEQSDGLCQQFTEQSQQPKEASVKQWHHKIVIHLPFFDAFGLFLLRTVLHDIIYFERLHSLGMRPMLVPTRDKHHHLLCGFCRLLIQKSMGQLFENLRLGDMITLPKLHVRTGWCQSSQLQAMTYTRCVKWFGWVEMTDGTSVIQNIL